MNGPPGSGGGGGSPGRHRHRTSTRLLLFAGSSWGRIGATFFVTIFLTKLLFEHLGLELAGLHFLFAFMTRFLTPLRGALARVMTREVAGALATKDDARVTRVFSNAVVLSGCTALFAFIVVGTMATFVVEIFKIPKEYASVSVTAMWCEAAIITSFLFFTPWLNLYVASQRVLSENISRTIERSLDLIAAVIAFWVFPIVPSLAGTNPLVSYSVSRAGLRVGQHIVRSGVIARAMPQARFHLSLVSRATLKALTGEGGWSFGNAVANVGFYITDQPFVNVYFGLAYNAIFGVVTKLQGMGQMLGNNVAFGLEAMVADHHEMGRHELNKRIMLAGMRVTSSVTVFCTMCVVLLAPRIVDLWLGKELRASEALQEMGYEHALTLMWSFAAILLPSVWFSQAMLVSTRVLYGMGHNRLFSPWLLAAAGLKIALAFVGLQFFNAGPMWVVWSTVIAQVWCFGWIFPRLIKKVFDLSMVRVFVDTYILPLLSTIPSVIVLLLAMEYLDEWSVESLMGVLMAAGVVYAPSFLFVALRSDERSRLFHLVRMGPRAAIGQMKKGGKKGKKFAAQSAESDGASGGGGGADD